MVLRFLAVAAAALVASGCFLIAVPVGLICAGFLLAALAALFVVEV